LRLWPFNHRKPFGRRKALTRNGSDPLNAPFPGRTGDKSNLKRQGHGILIDKVSLLIVQTPSCFMDSRAERGNRITTLCLLLALGGRDVRIHGEY
jgi:hypothetical protein